MSWRRAISRALPRSRPSAPAISGAEQRIAGGEQHQPERGFVHRPVLMALAQLVDQLVDRVEYRVQRLAIAGKDHPGRERAAALAAEGVEGAVDDLDRIGLMGAGAHAPPAAMPATTRSEISPASAACSPAAEPKWWSRLAWVLPISAATAFSVTACGPLLDQQPPRRLQRDRAAFSGDRRSRGRSY